MDQFGNKERAVIGTCGERGAEKSVDACHAKGVPLRFNITKEHLYF